MFACSGSLHFTAVHGISLNNTVCLSVCGGAGGGAVYLLACECLSLIYQAYTVYVVFAYKECTYVVYGFLHADVYTMDACL